MNAENRPSRSTEAFFGRRHGKTIRPQQAAALELGLASYRLDLTSPAPADLRELFSSAVSTVRLEIGFGGGEHLHHIASSQPQAGFIGIEPFVNGMARLMTTLAQEPLANLRVYDDDATRVLDWLPDGCLSGIDLLYPDPWPKKKHWKRRFVSKANLDRFARVMAKGAQFRFASDIDTYVNWTLLLCGKHQAFEWQADEAADWHRPYGGWVRTRYEAKAVREGRQPAYLTFLRR
ncbi:tRNA (guanosine(46)-N7)-methyltransferase TrmB [Pseudaminobacter arsenicus]|uniref:tRNA (guanine-N(7)-)-methyltransferase n=1 Tax=Borborobacter arsenicus TaxID=1851146 RepID=A0A432V2R9_9HYPH|nr:tRNA (guanosine(46)-N(7))-methyltransferase TrmB [Pseudaminobacter arsenicus]RUM96504.1 tRNA (guanosine(46)-N7)-methyltransferase TrmB [Pseudaminobacter arsenicus]